MLISEVKKMIILFSQANFAIPNGLFLGILYLQIQQMI